MNFKIGTFLAHIDRHGFIRVGGSGFHFSNASAPVRDAVKRAVAANPHHLDAPGILHVINNEEKS